MGTCLGLVILAGLSFFVKDSAVEAAGPGLYHAQSVGIVDAAQTPLGYEQLTTLSSAKAFTVPTGAVRLVVQAEGDDLRWRDDGTNPTASVGMILLEGDSIVYSGTLSAFKVIEVNGGGKANGSTYGN